MMFFRTLVKMSALFVFLQVALTHCVTGDDVSDTGEPGSGSGPEKSPESKDGTPPPSDVSCELLPKVKGPIPYFMPSQGLVLTKIMKPCSGPNGQIGLEKNSSWLAMGFPCTGGGGRIDIKGKFHNPKMVSFVVGTDCPMNPALKDQVQKIMSDALALPSEAKLIAYTPFVVQYWEVMGTSDADVGFSVELRTAPSLEGIWKRFRENESFTLRLYGRENAWVQGGHFYQVEAILRPSGKNSFQLDVRQVNSLSDAEFKSVKVRCEALKPSRNCNAVF